jgi:hypothetical protein
MYIVSFNAMYAENSIILANRLGIKFVQDMNPKQNDIIIVFGAKECADKLLMIQQQLNVEYIIIQTEQFYGKGFDNKYYLDLVQKNSVLDWSKENVKKLKKYLPNTPFYSLYFYDYLINNDLPHFNTRPIDFFFYGSENKEIEKTLKDFKMSNLDYNVEYDLSNNYNNAQALTEKLKQVKYVINLPYCKESVLDTHKINKALYMGCQVISLLSSDIDLNDIYKDYVYFVSRLNDFSLLLENEPKKTVLQLIEQYGALQIQNNINGINYAEKKLNEKLKLKELTNGNPPI